jgi:hypothetical protein
MQPSIEQPAAVTAGEGAEAPRWDARRGIFRVIVSILVFFALMATLAKLAGPRIEASGEAFVESFGYAGLAFGTILADGFSLPPPPLFYIVIVATAKSSHLDRMTVISIASMVAGVIGYHLAALLAARPFFGKRIDATRARMDGLFKRYSIWAFLIASATPLSPRRRLPRSSASS